MPELGPDFIRRVAVLMPALLFSLSVHEFAHAWTATRLGDATPRRQGRLTLSPLAHLDVMGSIVLPLILLAGSGGGVFFGWAKPVQFNPSAFSRRLSMRQGSALTAVAGPLSNVALAFLALLALRWWASAGDMGSVAARGGAGFSSFGLELVVGLIELNILLAVFNLLPLPPLDGGYLLPRSLDSVRAVLERYSLVIFLALFFIPIPGVNRPLGSLIVDPLMSALGAALQAVAFAEL